jgi:succinoglycan biosynthesis transport protein ExoP
MEKDERLLPLPNAPELNLTHQDVSAAYSPFYEEDFKEGRSIQEYFSVVYKRLPLILALTILATAATAFYMYRLPTIYEAQTVIVMDKRKPKMQSSQPVYIDFGDNKDYYNTQLRLLQSPELMKDVVIRLNLHRNPNLFAEENKSFVASLKSMFSSDKSANKESTLPTLTETSADSTTTKLTKEEDAVATNYAGILSLTAERVPDTNLVNIKVQSTYQDLVAKVTNAAAEIFIEKDADREVQGAKKVYEDLNKSIEDLKNIIAAKEQERIASMKRFNLPLQEDGDKFASAKLQTMSSQWLQAENERRRMQAQYEAAVQASRRGELPNVMDDNKHLTEVQNQDLLRKAALEGQLQKIDEQIQEAEARRSELLVRYTEEFGEVKSLTAKIEKLKQDRQTTETEGTRRIEREGVKNQKDVEKQVLTILQAKLAAAQKSEAQAYALYTNEVNAAGLQGQNAATLTTLTREIETSRQLLDSYTKTQKEQEIAISRDRPDNVFISSEAINGVPIGPNRSRNIIIAFLLSLMGGIGLAFLFDYLDDSIKTSDDVGRYLGLPTLALIPHYNTMRKSKETALTTKTGNPASKALVTLQDNRSPMAEAYRHLRTSLLFSSAGKPPQTILVTSSQPSEGKTTTAINTAITLSQAGAEVVIIDCDLRRPRLHSHFELENTTGLTNYLSGDKNAENLLKSYPGLPNLKIMTSGPIPPNPAELLTSNEMKNLLNYLKGNFKHVVIDSPPAISFTDAAILATLVDGVVFVAMANKSSLHLMKRFKQRLAGIGARIYGVVINGIKPNSVEYGYYGYGYTYSYYETPDDDDSTPRMEDKREEKYEVHTTER